MPAAHRHGDARVCGAATVVQGQSSVFVNGKLWAVEGDPNTDGLGNLLPSVNGVFAGGKRVIVHAPDAALPDLLCPMDPHCAPATAQGSPNVFVND